MHLIFVCVLSKGGGKLEKTVFYLKTSRAKEILLWTRMGAFRIKLWRFSVLQF